MSLLMDALKQAEQNKVKVKNRQSTTEPISGPGPEQADHQEAPDFPEIGTSGDPPSETMESASDDVMPVHDHNIDESFEVELRISETENTDIQTIKGVSPIVQALAEDIVEEPLAAELDFSEIEATIAADSRIAESDLQVVDAASVDNINLLQASVQSASDEQLKIAALSGDDKAVTATPALSMYFTFFLWVMDSFFY